MLLLNNNTQSDEININNAVTSRSVETLLLYTDLNNKSNNKSNNPSIEVSDSQTIDPNEEIILTQDHQKEIEIELLYNAALSVTNENVAAAICFICFHQLGYKRSCFQVLYHRAKDVYYKWNEDTLLWKRYYIDEIGGNLRRVSIRLALEKTNAVRNTLYQQYKEATDINIKDEIFVNYTRFNNLITKLQTDSFMNSTWNIILGDIEIDFDR